jgi:6-phosphogluconolactonase
LDGAIKKIDFVKINHGSKMKRINNSNKYFVVVGSYASPECPGIYSFLFNDMTGELTTISTFAGIMNASFLVIHPNRRWLYAVSETSKEKHGCLGSVWAFNIKHPQFPIEPINHQSSKGDSPCHLQFDSTGRWLLATNYGSGNACLFPIQSDGSLGEMTDFVQHSGNRVEGGIPHAHSSIFTPDNRYAIIADLGIDQLVMYKVDTVAGKLLAHSTINTRLGAGPRHLVFHRSGKWLYVANELDSTLTRYDYNAVNGALVERQTLATIPLNSPNNKVAELRISTQGDRLYVSNRGHNSIAVYDIDENGFLKLISIPSCGGDWPRSFALVPDGHHMLVANQYSNNIGVFSINKENRSLAQIGCVTVTNPSCIQLYEFDGDSINGSV